MTAREPGAAAVEYAVAEPARPYYDRTGDQQAVQIISEMVDEWDYSEDAHGYCHVRPALVRLLEIAARCDLVADRSTVTPSTGSAR